MSDLTGFRDAVRAHRRTAGRTQKQLARAIGLHPDVLSHKLNGTDHAIVTTADAVAIVTTLAQWASLSSRADAEQLLGMLDVPPHAIDEGAWRRPPLAALTEPPTPRNGADDLGAAAVRSATDPARSAGRRRPAPAPHPVPLTPLVGRTAELAAIREALSASRLVTLTGTSGVGKTRLAVQSARELADNSADRVVFVDLSVVRDPGSVAIALARALGLRPASAEAGEEQVAAALAEQPTLLVLDNLEHLLEAAPVLVRLLAAAPAARMLTTSRIPLRVYGEAVLRVPPLALRGERGSADSAAVQLFLQRARAARADFTADDGDLGAVARICAAVDGLPLAIELAAARTKLYPPQALSVLLDERRAVLADGPRDLPRRQQTLQAALDWSYDLLDGPAQQLFSSLSAFAGPFDAAAATAVHGRDEDAEDMLSRLESLCDQSLLEVVPGATPRFRFLQPVRDYAGSRLAEAGARGSYRRLLEYYLAVATGDGRESIPATRRQGGMDDLEIAYPSIRAAFDVARRDATGDSLDLALRLAVALSPLWWTRVSIAEGARQFDQLLAADERVQAATPATRAYALNEYAGLECLRGNYASAIELAERGRMLCDDLADHRGLARSHRILGESVLAAGDFDAAEDHFARQLGEAGRMQNHLLEAAAYNMLGQVARHRGRFKEATALSRRSLRLYGAVHDSAGVTAVMHSLGEIARDAGDADGAERRFAAALCRDQRTGNNRGMAYHLEGMATVAALRGDGRGALHHLGAARSCRERSGGALPPVERAIIDRILAPAVSGLDDDERAEALAEGRRQLVDER